MIRSWMMTWFSMENSATFMFNVCLTCQRLWNQSLVDEAQPICKLSTWDYVECLRELNEGHPVEYQLPYYNPLTCSMKLEK